MMNRSLNFLSVLSLLILSCFYNSNSNQIYIDFENREAVLTRMNSEESLSGYEYQLSSNNTQYPFKFYSKSGIVKQCGSKVLLFTFDEISELLEFKADGSFSFRKINIPNLKEVNDISFSYDCREIYLLGSLLNQDENLIIYEIESEKRRILNLYATAMVATDNEVFFVDGRKVLYANKSFGKIDTTEISENFAPYLLCQIKDSIYLSDIVFYGKLARYSLKTRKIAYLNTPLFPSSDQKKGVQDIYCSKKSGSGILLLGDGKIYRFAGSDLILYKDIKQDIQYSYFREKKNQVYAFLSNGNVEIISFK